jgi:transcription termination/antitermination protein NusA
VELIRRAGAFLEKRDNELNERRMEMGVTDDVAAIETLTPAMLVALGEKGVKTLDDLGDLASDELIEIVGADNMDEETANAIIMSARAHWFEGDETAGTAPASASPGTTQEAHHD